MIFNRTFVFVHVKTFASHEKITPLLIRNRRFDDDQRARSTRSATGCRHLREIQGGNGGLYFLSSTYKCNFLGADNKQ